MLLEYVTFFSENKPIITKDKKVYVYPEEVIGAELFEAWLKM